MMMMTAEYSCGWLGHHPQNGFKPHPAPTTTTTTTMPSPPPPSQHRLHNHHINNSSKKPLRHSIDAILHTKASPKPSWSSTSANPHPLWWSSHKPTLPHIETLRRMNPRWPKPSGQLPLEEGGDGRSGGGYCRSGGRDCRSGHGDYRSDGGDCRSSDSSCCHSTTPDDSSSSLEEEPEEDVVVVDVDTEDDSAVDMQEEESSAEEHSQERPGSKDSRNNNGVNPASEQRPQRAATTLETYAFCPGLCPRQNENVPSTRYHAARATPSRAEGPCYLQGSFEKVKSAFRPIVRPWLLDNRGSPPACSAAAMLVPAPGVCRDQLRSLQAKHVQLGARSLDTISMLRKQSSVFREACSNNGNSSNSNGRAQPHKAALTALDNGQPLPSSLTSWLSWLRLGGLPFGPPHPPPPHHHHHHHQQHISPTPCRGGVPPSSPSSGSPGGPFHPHPHPPPQAPRYNCDACGKSYSTFGGLSKHKQFHCAAQIKKEFRCKFCDKSYSSLGALKMHIRTHTLPCKCTVCGKAFSRPWLLQGHLRTHTGEKPFSCPHCARAFADRSNLRAHLQTHSDVKKYSCRHCAKTFSRMSLLAKHRESSCMGLHS